MTKHTSKGLFSAPLEPYPVGGSPIVHMLTGESTPSSVRIQLGSKVYKSGRELRSTEYTTDSKAGMQDNEEQDRHLHNTTFDFDSDDDGDNMNVTTTENPYQNEMQSKQTS